MENTSENKKIPVLGSLLIVILVIAGIVFTLERTPNKKQDDTKVPVSVAMPTESDHVYGSLNAPITIIEWSDSECPYCKSAHPNVKTVLATYGDNVSFVYRHFPLESIHPNARKEARALECVGKENFFKYLDTVFAVEGDNTDSLLQKGAEDLGVKADSFKKCMTDTLTDMSIDADITLGEHSGVQGTPAFFFLNKKGTVVPAFGSQSVEDMTYIINKLLAE